MQESWGKSSYSAIYTGVWRHHVYDDVYVLTDAFASYPEPGYEVYLWCSPIEKVLPQLEESYISCQLEAAPLPKSQIHA